MGNFTSKIFQNHQVLIADLTKKAECYPLISQLYLPVIKEHIKTYGSAIDCDDWLFIPHFQWLWLSDNDNELGLSCKNRMEKMEIDLKKIYESLGKDEFKKMCADLLPFAKHKTVNGVHNKLYDFYGELKGMLHFINMGYSIERIPREDDKKTPDFRATKDGDVVIVECKFIHESEPVKTFVKRHITFLETKPGFWESGSLRPWHNFSYSAHPQDLEESHIKDLKNFINQIVDEKRNSNDIKLKHPYKVNVHYERKDTIELGLVTIEDQLSYAEDQLEIFFKEYIFRRITQLTPQLKQYAKESERQCAFIFLELDTIYDLPYAEMDKLKEQIKENFKKRLSIDAIFYEPQ